MKLVQNHLILNEDDGDAVRTRMNSLEFDKDEGQGYVLLDMQPVGMSPLPQIKKSLAEIAEQTSIISSVPASFLHERNQQSSLIQHYST